jgi:hypothetical protein
LSDDLTKTRPSILATSLEDDGKLLQVQQFPTDEKKQIVRDDVKITPDASGHQTVLLRGHV